MQEPGETEADWQTEVKLCTLKSPSGSDHAVRVFADKSENTRYVMIGHKEGLNSDDSFIETMVKCKGEFPQTCLRNATGNVPDGCRACPCDPDLEHSPFGNYQRHMLKLLKPLCQSPTKETDRSPFRVLLIGLGGGALVQYVLDQCPQGTIVEVAEYDARMIEVANRFFNLQSRTDVVKMVQGDGGALVATRASEGKTYDAVIVDAFKGGSRVPESCRSAQFINNVRRILRGRGTVVHNFATSSGDLQRLLHGLGSVDFEATLPLYRKGFGDKFVRIEKLKGGGEFPSHLVVATRAP